ncbi:alpha/beta hydrolase [Nonomuraea maheshkhaliensis]|uniref:alpha/beta hydrolase n=1 Tax=Nonomuraea maheshkhaliensis TaxID=419590 RepID=UPI0031F8E384
MGRRAWPVRDVHPSAHEGRLPRRGARRAQLPPLLVVHDRDDQVVDLTGAEAITKAWPRAELLRTEGLGHQRILRDPEVVRQVVRFLAGPPR